MDILNSCSFIYGLLKDTISNSDYVALSDGMVCEQWIGKSVEQSSHGLIWGTTLQELRKTMKNLNQDIWSWNPAPPNMK
jgi:hypothetical protein